MEKLTTKQYAEKFGINESRVRQLCISGRLDAVKFGKSWAIPDRDFERQTRGPKRDDG